MIQMIYNNTVNFIFVILVDKNGKYLMWNIGGKTNKETFNRIVVKVL